MTELDVCVVSDALDALGRDGAVAGIRPVWAGGHCRGRVLTMKVVLAAGVRADSHLGAEAIDLAEPGDVIVIQQERTAEGEVLSATWGGLLARAALRRQVAGIVIDGACRDVDEIRQLGLPVSATHAMPFTARRRYVEHSVGEDLVVGGVKVSTGDFVIADGSGVAFVRASEVDEVLGRAGRLVRRESLMIGELEAGEKTAMVLGKDYEAMLDD